ncbi:hypothetical protein [Halalkalibacter hemicellulosilyticus]|uniref:Uncharacterized protein n=1 Tax=Halalkalibacter hemicellulosilyticusJCM 9152 TaxID=1236971 RepID=W4QED4_9BACI|nr:hypothetical protein [Halalkalibacter hemicellulosilyticus]GAE30312.1 hypothetical protein JCM9152_1716 [Halalkalibacter hemicellulosilyticusJCM 9152]
MEMIPFTHTWPYEMMMGDIYFQSCPFCHEEQVRTNMKKAEFQRAHEGIKTRLIMPCCHGVMTILEADDDYFWTDKPLRKG